MALLNFITKKDCIADSVLIHLNNFMKEIRVKISNDSREC